LVDAGAAGVVTSSVFEDEMGAELAAGWVKENQTALALGSPQVRRGAITIRHVNERVRAGYGFVWRYAFKSADSTRSRSGFATASCRC
jgi:hypothetical protein